MPADPTPSALDALLRYAETEFHPAPRLAAIIRALAGPAAEVLAAYDALVSGKSIPSYGAVDRLRTALARAEAIASGRDPATTPNPTTHTIPADAPASDAGTQHKEP